MKRTLGLLVALLGCELEEPSNDGGVSGRVPGAAFETNQCFSCTMQACSVSRNACASNGACWAWLDCVGDCPTAANGVSAEAECAAACGLPVAAEVLYGCIQDYANGSFQGCGVACQALPRDASVRD